MRSAKHNPGETRQAPDTDFLVCGGERKEDKDLEQEHVPSADAEFRKIVDAIPAYIGVVTPDGIIAYTNKTVRDFTGFGPEEVSRPDHAHRVYHPEDNERLLDERRRLLLGVTPFRQERRVLGKNGQYRWFLMQYNPTLDDQGRVLRWYVTATDIDDHVRAAETTRNENLILREQIERNSMYEDIVGSSAPLRRVLSQISKVAPSDSTVLILGETGTGKELVARAIHKRSSRASRAFIAVNCAAIPTSLIASELFGHEKGAFTGAAQRRLGRFAAANGGTIFLDQIGDLSQEIQIALLRVLQQHEIERVGCDRPIPVGIRAELPSCRRLWMASAWPLLRASFKSTRSGVVRRSSPEKRWRDSG